MGSVWVRAAGSSKHSVSPEGEAALAQWRQPSRAQVELGSLPGSAPREFPSFVAEQVSWVLKHRYEVSAVLLRSLSPWHLSSPTPVGHTQVRVTGIVTSLFSLLLVMVFLLMGRC